MNDRAPIPTWAYKGDEAKLFDHPDDVPKGWSDSPAPAKPAKVKPQAEPAPETTPESGDES